MGYFHFSVPAPHVTQAKEADVTTIHKPAPIVTKQVHLGQTSYISGYATNILKPAIPDFKIAVPTALKGTVATNPAAVTVQKEIHTVNQPVPVEKPYNVPYDVIKHVEKVVEVPTPVHVAKPVPYDVPTPVVGKLTLEKMVSRYFCFKPKLLKRMLQASTFRSKVRRDSVYCSLFGLVFFVHDHIIRICSTCLKLSLIVCI